MRAVCDASPVAGKEKGRLNIFYHVQTASALYYQLIALFCPPNRAAIRRCRSTCSYRAPFGRMCLQQARLALRRVAGAGGLGIGHGEAERFGHALAIGRVAGVAVADVAVFDEVGRIAHGGGGVVK